METHQHSHHGREARTFRPCARTRPLNSRRIYLTFFVFALKANASIKPVCLPQQNEIFASRHQDVNSVACIEDKCYVLTLAQYCR